MTLTEGIEVSARDGERIVVRLLRCYRAMRDHADDGRNLSRFVLLGQRLRVPPAGSVALASVFQLTEAVLGRPLRTEGRCARRTSGDERAIVRMLGSPMPRVSGAATPAIPHGLPGALTWAVWSVRRLCGDLVPSAPLDTSGDEEACPFATAVAG